MAIDDNNLVKPGGSDTAGGSVRSSKSYSSKKKALASKKMGKKEGFDGNKRWGNSAQKGYGVNSPAMMEARAKFDKKPKEVKDKFTKSSLFNTRKSREFVRELESGKSDFIR